MILLASLIADLSNPTRLRIAELLVERERTVNEVAQLLGIHQPNASLNLATLQRAGIAKVTPKGNVRTYLLRGPRIAQIIALAYGFLNLHSNSISNEPVEDDLTEIKEEISRVQGAPI